MPSYDPLNEIQLVEPPETSVTIPDGATGVGISAFGGGGAGEWDPLETGGGGGGGSGRAYKLYTVLEAEWGTTLSLSIGVGVLNASGTNTTVNGTLNGSVITTLQANGGSRASGFTGGAGGTASGGDDNATGDSGEAGSAGVDGDGGSAPRSLDDDFFTNAGNGTGASTSKTTGQDGAVILHWYY